MKKYFLTALLILPVLFISFISVNVFAQSTNWEDYGLDEQMIQYLTEEEKQAILESRTPEQTIEFIKTLSEEDLEGTPFSNFADGSIDGTPSLNSREDVVGCFDYYEFGSVTADFSASTANSISGMSMTFNGVIENNNNYPIVDGIVYVKVFKKRGSEKDANGPDVVDQFIAVENVNLSAQSSKPATFDWKVPANAESGDYQIATFFITNDKFNLLGLSFTDDVVGNTFDFKVNGSSEIVKFDKSSVTINENPYYFAAFPPRVDEGVPASVKVEIENTTDSDENVEVSWNLYRWDAQNEDNFIRTDNDSYVVPAGSSVPIEISIEDDDYPVYYLVAELKYKDTKSIINIRFVRDEENRSRLNFPAVIDYPLKAGQEATMFSCLHNSGVSPIVENNRLVMEIRDKGGRLINQYEYRGEVTGNMMAVKDTFVPQKDISDFTLSTKLYTDGVLVDESVIEYSCDDIDPAQCVEEGTEIPVREIIIGGIVLLLLILLITLFKGKTKGIELVVIMFAIATALIVGPNVTEAKSAVWNESYTQKLAYFWNWSAGDDTGSTGYYGAAGWAPALMDPNVTITYNVEIMNLDTGVIVRDGDSVPTGTNLTLKFMPHEYRDIYWFGTGYSLDSPYGEWREGAAPPARVNGKVTCESKDFVNDGVASGWEYKTYVPLVVDQPEKNITNLEGLSCGELSGDGSGGYEMQCVVTGEGDIAPTFNFSDTEGKFYYRYYGTAGSWYSSQVGCWGNNVPLVKVKDVDARVFENIYGLVPRFLDGPFELDVPSQSVTYNLNAFTVGENQPPNPPTISGPSSGSLNSSGNFTGNYSFVATDPDGDQINYQIDWTNDGSVNQTLPSLGYVNSGASQSTQKTFNSLPSEFKARTVDNKGAFSAWSSYTVNENVTSAGPECDLSVINGCKNGSNATDITESDTAYTWKCELSGDYSPICRIPKNTGDPGGPSDPGGDPVVSDFYLNPTLEPCAVYLEATGVSSCTVGSNNYLATDGDISISGSTTVDHGTYQAVCFDSAGDEVYRSNALRCISNPDIIQQ